MKALIQIGRSITHSDRRRSKPAINDCLGTVLHLKPIEETPGRILRKYQNWCLDIVLLPLEHSVEIELKQHPFNIPYIDLRGRPTTVATDLCHGISKTLDRDANRNQNLLGSRKRSFTRKLHANWRSNNTTFMFNYRTFRISQVPTKKESSSNSSSIIKQIIILTRNLRKSIRPRIMICLKDVRSNRRPFQQWRITW